jgi:hypothetical protein
MQAGASFPGRRAVEPDRFPPFQDMKMCPAAEQVLADALNRSETI